MAQQVAHASKGGASKASGVPLKKSQSLPTKIKSKPASAPILKKEDAIKEEESSDLVKDVESKLALDDWAKNIKLIWSSDKEAGVKSHYQSTQWMKFKNGTKNRLYNCQLTDTTH